MKTYLEFQKEVKDIIFKIAIETFSESKTDIYKEEVAVALAKRISTQSAMRISFTVHHTIRPLDPGEQYWGGIE